MLGAASGGRDGGFRGRNVAHAISARLVGVTPALADDLALAHRLADAADELPAAAFTGEAVAHELKPDGSPVSETDLLAKYRA